jgi:hypothetical protein
LPDVQVTLDMWKDRREFSGYHSSIVTAGPERLRGRTDADGRYALIVDEPGRYTYSIWTSGARSAEVRGPLAIPEGESFAADIKLGGASVRGLVVDDASRQPVAKVEVSAMRGRSTAGTHPSFQGESGWSAVAETGSDGTFTLQLDPGEYRLHPRADGYAQPRDGVVIKVPEEGLADVTIPISRGKRIRGRVVNSAGEGMAAVEVRSAPEGTYMYTSTDGTFEIVGLQKEKHTVIACSPTGSFAVAYSVLAGDGPPLLLRLAPGGHILLSVRDAAGRPVPGAWTSPRLADDTERTTTSLSANSDANGTVDVMVPVGEIILSVGKDDLRGQTRVTIGPGARVPVTISLERLDRRKREIPGSR